MKQFYTGETVSLYFEHRDSGALANRTTSSYIAVEDSSGQVVVVATTVLPSTGVTGKYEYNYTIDDAAKTGVYKAQAIFRNNTNYNKEGTVVFEVLEKVG